MREMERQAILQEAASKYNYPSAGRLYNALKAHQVEGGYDKFKLKEVNAFVKKQPANQIFTEFHRRRRAKTRAAGPKIIPQRGEGSFVAFGIDDRWMADLADLTAQPSIPEDDADVEHPYQYILVVLDVFSRKLFARPLRTKDPTTVLNAFKEILHGQRKPARLDTDAGPEFKGPFKAFLDEQHIFHTERGPMSPNGLAPVDSAIKTLKRSIFRRVVGDKDRDWAANLQATVAGMNGQAHSSLVGRSPDQVAGDQVLQFQLRRKEADAAVHNASLIHKRDAKLVEEGAFREQLPMREHQRSYQPRYGNEVHEVTAVHLGQVVDGAGRVWSTRHVLAVPSGSAPATHTEGMHGGNALIERKNRDALAPYRDRVRAHVGEGKWIHEMAEYMKSLGMQPLMKGALNYKKAVLSFGLRVDDRGRVTDPDHVPAAPAAVAPVAPAAAGPSAAFDAAPRPVLAPAEARRRLNVKTSSHAPAGPPS
jgi:hypothetical protein